MKRIGILVLALSTMLGGEAAWPAETSLVGRPAPAFILRDMKGGEVSLSDLRGRVVVLHFWATWCPMCRSEMPALQEFSRAHPENVIVLGVNLGERKKTVAAYQADLGLTFPVLRDPRGKVAAAYGVMSLPTTFLVGPDGVAAAQLPMGLLQREDLERRLEELTQPQHVEGGPEHR
ncbi:MAG TPA: TlpA disulfide reductase family protein [Candidatus Polarisedimenticolia bacterium]|nr:TlpA disulfide reductase family protein [Candidatus Polarisedimenticolia bacterium]